MNVPQISVKQRRQQLLAKMMEGNSTANLRDWWMEEFNRTDHTYQKDITWCNNKMKLFLKDEHEDIIANHLSRYDRNAEAAFDALQFGASNQALQFKEKLLGMHRPETVAFIQNNNFNLEQLTNDEIIELLDKYDNEK